MTGSAEGVGLSLGFMEGFIDVVAEYLARVWKDTFGIRIDLEPVDMAELQRRRSERDYDILLMPLASSDMASPIPALTEGVDVDDQEFELLVERILEATSRDQCDELVKKTDAYLTVPAESRPEQ